MNNYAPWWEAPADVHTWVPVTVMAHWRLEDSNGVDVVAVVAYLRANGGCTFVRGEGSRTEIDLAHVPGLPPLDFLGRRLDNGELLTKGVKDAKDGSDV